MISGSCHCGAVRIHVPRAPEELTNCNCSLCRRLGGLWAYYPVDEVRVEGHPQHTDGYIQGDRTLRTVRCKTCGCTTHWEPLDPTQHRKMGVNMRNFDPEVVGEVRIRLIDGADTWKSFYWEDLQR
jgi:hypothetical protein